MAENLNNRVTTENSYTVAAVEPPKSAMDVTGIDSRRGTLAVVGLLGEIRRVCAQLLAREARAKISVGLTLSKL